MIDAALLVARAFIRAAIVTICCFFLTMTLFEVVPGDAARAFAGAQASAMDLTRLRTSRADGSSNRASCIDVAARYFHGARSAGPHETCAAFGPVHLDLGTSYVYRRPVRTLLAERVGASLALAASVAVACATLGVFLGFVSRELGAAVSLVSTFRAVSAVPAYAIGVLLHEVFARRLGWLPHETHFETFGQSVRSMVLPLATLTLAMVGPYVAVAHERWQELARAAFVRAAEARGARPSHALWRHGNRQVFGALAAMSFLDAALLVGGAVLTERLFRWPGVGSLAVEALLGRDLDLLAGVVVLAATVVAVVTAVGEALRPLFDPRTRY